MNNQIRIAFVGDVFPADQSLSAGFGIKSMFLSRKEIWAKDIASVVGDVDFVVGNIESPLVHKSTILHNSFYGLPEFAQFLKKNKFEVLNVANNHILEQGERGFADTISILKDNSIKTIGGMDVDQPEILYMKQKGIKIALAGFCDERICAIRNGGIYASLSERTIMETLDRMIKSNADFRVIILHWGNEYIHYPSLEQRLLAYKLIDNGAHLVIGHHSHCIQPYEQYHDGHILYSLGNFCFDDLQTEMVSNGMIAKVIIDNNYIQSIQLCGVRLYDTVYSKHLVSTIPQMKFEKLYARIMRKYSILCRLPDIKYEKRYLMQVKINRFWQRMAKKIILLWKLLITRTAIKKYLIRNIGSYYFH